MLSLKEIRKDRGYTQQVLADLLGISKQAYSNYELGKRTPDIKTLDKLAKFYCVPIESFLSEDAIPVDSIRIPVFRAVPAGIPIEAIEDIVDWESIPKKMTYGGKQYFGLVVRGDSMYPKYLDGDTIIVLKQSYCDSGKDCVVYVNGYNATLKKVTLNDDHSLTLTPLNPNYSPQTFLPQEVQTGYVAIAGVVVEIRRKV